VIPSGGGEVVGDSPERRVEILSEDATLHSTWSRFGPHREGADLHIHRQHTDLFYVLEGELTVMLGTAGGTAEVQAGTLARVPPLVVHGFRNASSEEVRYPKFHAPGRGFADYLRALRDGRTLAYDQHPPPAEGGRPTSEAAVGGEELVADRDDLRVALLADVDEVGMAETWSDADGPSPPAHVHRRHVESFYVIEGELAFTLDGVQRRAEAGSWVQVPVGIGHTFAPTGAGPTRYLDVHTPSCGFATFVRGLHAARTAEEPSAVRAGFDQEPV
jgi:mannose-6-phosphate isomerase-like protein (cupin superfamily)